MLFKNKHLVTALIVTPVLAIGGFLATDYFLSEPARPAQPGGSYPLALSSNCRYASGQCDLNNGNFKLVVRGKALPGDGLSLALEAAFALDAVYVSVVSGPAMAVEPAAMQQRDNVATQWQIQLPVKQPQQQYLRVVAVADGAAYYAQTTLVFLDYKTSFNKDFR